MVSRLILGVSLSLLAATAFTPPALANDGRTLQIIVSRDTQSLVVYNGDQVVATSKVSTGKAGHSTPTGIFSILEKKKYHESNLYSNAPMPYMQRITWSGVALHESNHVPNYPASHGCVRMPGKFAKTLFQMTERGAHVIITDEPVVPVAFSHANLFKPHNPLIEEQLMSDAELRPTTPDPVLRPVELAMNEVLPKIGATATAVIEEMPPIRILITRRGPREAMIDAQTLLNTLGYAAGDVDGQAGSVTIAAINAFKTANNLPAKGELLSPEFMTALYKAAGKGTPPSGQILVRQKFKPIIEAPVVIDQPDVALGTLFFEATDVMRTAGKVQWHALSLDNHLSDQQMKRLGITAGADAKDPELMSKTLDRIRIPEDVRRKIETLLSDGSSLTIADVGLGSETGQGTDFITLTKRTPKGKSKS